MEAQTISGILGSIKDLLNSLIPIIFIIATIVFLWGVVMFITAGGDEDKRSEGRQYIIFGLIGLFVMISVWGIVNVLVGFFGFGGASAPTISNLPGISTSTFNPCLGNLGGAGCE